MVAENSFVVNLVRLFGEIVYLLDQRMETGRAEKKVIERHYSELKLIKYANVVG